MPEIQLSCPTAGSYTDIYVHQQAAYSFNKAPEGTPTSESKQIDVILTDGRFHRDTLPCEVRRDS